MSVTITPHPLWMPVPLSADPDVFHDEMLQHFGNDEDVSLNADMLTGLVRNLAAANAAYDAGGNDGVLNAAAWALLTETDVLDVRAVAILQVLVLSPDMTVEDVIKEIADGADVLQTPLAAKLETASGDAENVRLRVVADDKTSVHEMAAILWQRPGVTEAEVDPGMAAGPLPENAMWYVLSTYTTELSQADEVGDRLEELGAGIGGL